VYGHAAMSRLASMARRYRRWLLGAGAVAVLVGNVVIGYDVVTASMQSSLPVASGLHTSHSPRLEAKNPISIPPAPDPPAAQQAAAAPTQPVGAVSSPVDDAGDAADTGDSAAPAGAEAAPPTVNGTPTDIVDPSTIATATVHTLPLYSSPGATTPVSSLPNPNYLGAPLVLLVTAIRPGWIQGYIPVRPNESTAWFPAQDVTLGSVPCHIAIGLGAHLLVLYCNNAPVWQATVASGAPGSPTPTGSYFVAYIVRLTDPGGPYGPYAMGTSDYSNTYYSFEGGPGQIGIHGTDQPWVIGFYASHGCVRLSNQDITELASKVVAGTPVEISN
jgi:hypothetical protein